MHIQYVHTYVCVYWCLCSSTVEGTTPGPSDTLKKHCPQSTLRVKIIKRFALQEWPGCPSGLGTFTGMHTRTKLHVVVDKVEPVQHES